MRALEIPAPIAALIDARARFTQVMAATGEDALARRRFALENATLQYRYGDWERARPALTRLFEAGCEGPEAWEGGAFAWMALRTMALSLGRYDTVATLGGAVERCTFGWEAASCTRGNEDPRCVAREDRITARLRGGAQFLERAQAARGDERRELATRAGDVFLEALDGDLEPRGRIEALLAAGGAYRLGGALDRAEEVDDRILREARSDRLPEEDRELGLGAIGEVLTRRLDAAIAAEDHNAVVRLAGALLADPLGIEPLEEARGRARAALPPALEARGRHREAAEAYAALAAGTADPAARRDAALHAALASFAAGGCRRGTDPLRAFVASMADQVAEARDAIVAADWALLSCARAGSDEATALLEDLASHAGHPGMSHEAHDRAAEAAFTLADEGFDEDTRFAIRIPQVHNVEDMVAALRGQVAAPRQGLEERLAAYRGVARLGVGRWTVAAHRRSGQALEALAAAVTASEWDIPTDLAQNRSRLSDHMFNQILHITRTRAAAIQADAAGPLICEAAEHYDRAIEVAASQEVDDAHARAARERRAALQLPVRCPRR